jgi:hypothetical protein
VATTGNAHWFLNRVAAKRLHGAEHARPEAQTQNMFTSCARWWYVGLVAMAVFTLAARAGETPRTWHDDFRAPAGSDGAPAWEAETVGWEVRDNAYFGDSGCSVWRAVSCGDVVTLACDITVLEQLAGSWLVAGIALGADDKDFWAINLVVAPEAQQRRRSVDMHESLAGHWLAESQPDTRLPHRPDNHGGDFQWQMNKTYRLELQLRHDEVGGRVLDAGREVARLGFRFKDNVSAVRAGRPMLRANGLRVRFANATATVEHTAPEPVIVRPAVPAWTPRSGQPLAPGTGFFRTLFVEDGKELPPSEAARIEAHPRARWWLVDPEGKPFFDVGTDHVNYQAHWCESLGYAPYHRNVAAKFGSEETWAASALERLKAWGFNSLPAGHSPSLRHRGLPHMLFASFGTSFAKREWICEPIHWTGFPDVFSPRWERHCRIVAKRFAAESQGDPWCLGTFLDNELEWYGKRGSLVDEVFQRGAGQPAKKALFRWLLRRYGNLAEVNRRLGTQYADEPAFLAATTVPPTSPGLAEVREEFLAEIAERYFGVAAGAMRQADPQHLVLGCRFAGRAPQAVLSAAGKYNDVYTFNTYPRVDFENLWRADGLGGVVQRVPRQLMEMYAVVRRPMIITEWSFPALDSGLPCQHGAGMRVDTQAQKAACYRIFAQAMADLPFMVGYHYFMWVDEPAPGISSTFPEDSNYGLVNERDETYTVLVQTATAVNRAAAARHARSQFSGDLALRADAGGVLVSNPGQLPALGTLRIVSGGQSRIEALLLAPHGSRRVTVDRAAAWSVELQQWDGTKQRCAGGTPLQPHAAAHLTETDRLTLKAAGTTWHAAQGAGSLFDAIEAEGLVLGRLAFAVHQQSGGHDFWTEANRVVSLRVQEQADGWMVEAVVEFVGTAGRGPGQYRAGLRATVLKQGGIALVKPLWVENTDTRAWRLADAFWFCRAVIGGTATDDDVGGPKVPNYYRPIQFCTDTKLGGCFGALSPPDAWQVMFWKDAGGQIHPDTRWTVDRDLPPGQRWTAQEVPYLWVFSLRSADGWRDVTRRYGQATNLITADRKP